MLDSKLLPSTMNADNNLSLDAHLQLKLIEFAEKQGTLTETLKLRKLELLLKTRLYNQIQKTLQELQPNNKNLIEGKLIIIQLSARKKQKTNQKNRS